MSARDEFIRRVRQAASAGNSPGESAPIEPRGSVGYQGAGADLAVRFRDELAAAGGLAHLLPDRDRAVACVMDLLRASSARRVLLGRSTFLDSLELALSLGSAGIEVVDVNKLTSDSCREPFFAADVGISPVDYLLAETGSVVLLAGPEQPRSLSLLPPVHIAIAERGQLLPDLFDLFESPVWQERGGPPSSLSIITGPSKTGDIELRLVTGVHGPGEIHVIIVGA